MSGFSLKSQIKYFFVKGYSLKFIQAAIVGYSAKEVEKAYNELKAEKAQQDKVKTESCGKAHYLTKSDGVVFYRDQADGGRDRAALAMQKTEKKSHALKQIETVEKEIARLEMQNDLKEIKEIQSSKAGRPKKEIQQQESSFVWTEFERVYLAGGALISRLMFGKKMLAKVRIKDSEVQAEIFNNANQLVKHQSFLDQAAAKQWAEKECKELYNLP